MHTSYLKPFSLKDINDPDWRKTIRAYQKYLYRPDRRKKGKFIRGVGYIDMLCYGHDMDGHPRFVYRKETILEQLTGKRRGWYSLKKFSQSTLLDHCYGHWNWYYTSHSRSPYAMIGLDFDPAGHRQADNASTKEAWDCAKLIASYYFPDVDLCYETSTSGTGVHGYMLIDKGGSDSNANSRLRIHLERLGVALNNSIQSKGYGTTLELKGLPGGFCDGLYKNGTLMKLPRLTSVKACDRFFRGRMLTLQRLEEIAGKGNGAVGVQETTTYCDRNREGTFPPQTLESIKNDPSAFKRTLAAVKYLARMLRKPPSVSEAEDFYLNKGLYTPPIDNPARRIRIEHAVRYIADTWDDSKRPKSRWQVGQFIPLLKELISLDDIETGSRSVRYEHKLRSPYEALDVCLGYHTIKAFEIPADESQRQTAPVDGAIALFKFLKADGQIGQSCNKDKLRALRAILVQVDLIRCLDEKYTPKCFDPKGKGVSKKWGLGQRHPLHEEYRAVGGSDADS